MVKLGLRRCKPFNPDVPCTCSSNFTINQTTTVFVINENGAGIPVTGLFTLNCSICPNCNNAKSNFQMTFIDEDFSDGDQSFTMMPTSIEPAGCSILNHNGHLQQMIYFTGLYVPAMGDPRTVIGQMRFFETPGPGQDDLFFFDIQTLFPNVHVRSNFIPVPDEDLVVAQCE